MCTFTTFKSIIYCAVTFIQYRIVPLIVGFALVMFMWGIFLFIRNSTDETKREEGKQFMVWGLVGLAVMVSFWGVVAVLSGVFGTVPFIPQPKL